MQHFISQFNKIILKYLKLNKKVYTFLMKKITENVTKIKI